MSILRFVRRILAGQEDIPGLGAMLPTFLWRNSSTWPTTRDPRYATYIQDTLGKLAHLKNFIVSRAWSVAKETLGHAFGGRQLRRIIACILSFDVQRFNFQGWHVLTNDRCLEILQGWAWLGIKAADVRRKDLFSHMDITLLKEQGKRRTAELGNSLKQLIPDNGFSRLSRRGLLKRRAKDCAQRSGQLRVDIFALLWTLWTGGEGKTCTYCNAELSWAARAYRDGKVHICKVDPHVVSVDAFVPRSKGGLYSEGNVVLCCWACNVVKGDRTTDGFKQLLESLRSDRSELSDGFLRPLHLGLPTISLEGRAAISTVAKLRLTSIKATQAAQPRKCGALTFSKIADLLEATYAGAGRYLDPSGAVLTLDIVSIDRLDPQGGYDRQNVRVLAKELHGERSSSRRHFAGKVVGWSARRVPGAVGGGGVG